MPNPYSVADVITSGSLRRLRGSHYSAQRAELSQDALPLIRQGPRCDDSTRDNNNNNNNNRQSLPRTRPRSVPLIPPAPPQPVFQPHQLIAVCFNHMAGRECEHCRQMQSGMIGEERPDSEISTETLGQLRHSGYQQNENRYSGSEGNGEKQPYDGGEKGGKSPPPPVNIYDRRLSKLRLEMFGLWGRTTLILCTFILCVLSLYWAVLYHVEQNLSSLDVFVVDFDGTQPPYIDVTPIIGPMITQETEKMISSGQNGNHLGYITMSPSAFNNDPLQVRQAVYDFKAWAAIIINANATALLRSAVETGNSSYDPLGACQVVWVEARDQDTYYDYILPFLSALETSILSSFGKTWVPQVLANTSIPLTNLQAAPQALNPAIGFSQFSLRPFNPPVVTPAVTIGLIYLIIIAFFSFTFFLPIYSKLVTPHPDHPPVKFYQFVLTRWFGTVAAYFFMSFSYSLISLAFQIPFSNPPGAHTDVANNPDAYGKGTFVVYWMINWIGMIALGLACENVAMVIGQPWTAMWLIFWVISNVSTAFYSLDLAPKFYYWGYAWPLHNIVEASRSLLFDLHSRIGLNVGVLVVWCVLNTAVFPAACAFMRWKMVRGKRKEAEKKS